MSLTIHAIYTRLMVLVFHLGRLELRRARALVGSENWAAGLSYVATGWTDIRLLMASWTLE